MTNEEAIENLKCLFESTYVDRFEDAENEALKIAIKALEQEPCEDAINRDELLKAIDTWDKFGCDADTKLVRYQDHYVPYIHYDDVVKCIKGMPPVNLQPKIGYWLPYAEIDGKTVEWVCSSCRHIKSTTKNKTEYCPVCGARMESEV